MPYISPEKRPPLDDIVREMNQAGIRADGDLNYLLFAFCVRHVTPGYNNYKNFCAELEECANEIRRRLLGPYEDGKIKQNGDVSI